MSPTHGANCLINQKVRSPMKRILSLVLVICLLTAICTPASAAGLQTSSYAEAESYVELRHIFDEVIVPGSATNATVSMVITAVGRYWNKQADIGMGVGHVMKDGTPLYSLPSTDSSTLRTIDTQMNLTLTEANDGWYTVMADGTCGYLPVYAAVVTCENYPDLPFDELSAPYMAWAYETGLIEQMKPDMILSREDLASLLFNISRKLGYSLPDINTPFPFSDSGVSPLNMKPFKRCRLPV